MLILKPLEIGRLLVQRNPSSYFHCASRFATRVLAHMLDSLVRVSRRVEGNHFVNARPAAGSQRAFTAPKGCYQHPERGRQQNRRGHRMGAAPRASEQALRRTAISQAGLVPFASLSAISGTFNSLSKVLFTFPSWYLFAIGLEPVFSLR